MSRRQYLNVKRFFYTDRILISVTGGIVCTVQGSYEYRHYMQDGYDDKGWGCAYRSLQTIWSWLLINGYVTQPVPSHKDIQQMLADCGDKDQKFVGTKQWIGSFELSCCLNHALNVSSILALSNGAELDSKARQLILHFENGGSPVMIGGGAYAYTILGVHFDEVTGDARFLVLDPHYTGPEDIKTIIDKGWCGWKRSSFCHLFLMVLLL
ncbi:unnamed protein product [Soboliphyme baturini]|uniref:Ufm1-specific protease 1 n=1 Tax=Soboliphyme baturini TaxID=241478 RepID=A0A183IB15_9BILA|nr:unnamed protein product [Soboliphyme baturini]